VVAVIDGVAWGQTCGMTLLPTLSILGLRRRATPLHLPAACVAATAARRALLARAYINIYFMLNFVHHYKRMHRDNIFHNSESSYVLANKQHAGVLKTPRAQIARAWQTLVFNVKLSRQVYKTSSLPAAAHCCCVLPQRPL